MMMVNNTRHVPEIEWSKIKELLADKELPCSYEALTLLENLDSEEVSLQELADHILKDYGLTNKVIKLANSCFYNPNGVEIITVSKAILFLGFEKIREIILVSDYLEEIIAKTNSNNRETVLRLLGQTFLGAYLGRQIAFHLKIPLEEFFIQLLFHRLIRIILAIYFPELYKKIEIFEQENPQKLKRKLFRLASFMGQKWSLPEILISTFEGSPAAQKENHPAKYIETISDAVKFLSTGQKEKAFELLQRNFKLKKEEIEQKIKKAIEITRELHDSLLKELRFSINTKKVETKVDISNEFLFEKAIKEITSNLVSQADFQYILSIVAETLIRVFNCETVLFGIYNQVSKSIVIRYSLGKNRRIWKGRNFYINDILEKIFAKQIEWTCSAKNTSELFPFIENEKELMFSPLVFLGRPLGILIAIRNYPFSGEDLQKIEILRNLFLLSFQSLSKIFR